MINRSLSGGEADNEELFRSGLELAEDGEGIGILGKWERLIRARGDSENFI